MRVVCVWQWVARYSKPMFEQPKWHARITVMLKGDLMCPCWSEAL